MHRDIAYKKKSLLRHADYNRIGKSRPKQARTILNFSLHNFHDTCCGRTNNFCLIPKDVLSKTSRTNNKTHRRLPAKLAPRVYSGTFPFVLIFSVIAGRVDWIKLDLGSSRPKCRLRKKCSRPFWRWAREGQGLSVYSVCSCPSLSHRTVLHCCRAMARLQLLLIALLAILYVACM